MKKIFLAGWIVLLLSNIVIAQHQPIETLKEETVEDLSLKLKNLNELLKKIQKSFSHMIPDCYIPIFY